MSDRTTMSAEEGADRVWARSKARRGRGHETESQEDSEHQFTCECCGAHEFELIHEYDEVHHLEKSLPCVCGEHELATVHEEFLVYQMKEYGLLTVDHRVEFENREEVGKELEQGDSEVNCQECVDQAESSEWDNEEVSDPEVDATTEHFELRCANCDHEIEFGWSHPNRGGRIWPCESNDFNPFKCWPEPRFAEGWERRGWLRPI